MLKQESDRLFILTGPPTGQILAGLETYLYAKVDEVYAL